MKPIYDETREYVPLLKTLYKPVLTVRVLGFMPTQKEKDGGLDFGLVCVLLDGDVGKVKELMGQIGEPEKPLAWVVEGLPNEASIIRQAIERADTAFAAAEGLVAKKGPGK